MSTTEKKKTVKDKWFKIRELFERQFGKTPDLSAILYVVGLRELGQASARIQKRRKGATHAHSHM